MQLQTSSTEKLGLQVQTFSNENMTNTPKNQMQKMSKNNCNISHPCHSLHVFSTAGTLSQLQDSEGRSALVSPLHHFEKQKTPCPTELCHRDQNIAQHPMNLEGCNPYSLGYGTYDSVQKFSQGFKGGTSHCPGYATAP